MNSGPHTTPSVSPAAKSPHVHEWVDKALLHEPPLKVCACGATLTDREYRNSDAAKSRFVRSNEWFIDYCGGGWWVHHREDRQPRRGPFATHPEAVREYSRLTEPTQSHAGHARR